MDIGRDGSRDSQFVVGVNAAQDYGLSRAQARDIIEFQVTTIRENWDDVAELSQLTTVEKNALFGRQILNPYAAYRLEPQARCSAENEKRPHFWGLLLSQPACPRGDQARWPTLVLRADLWLP